MPLRNRVRPDGELIATPARGSLVGNRGVLHDDAKRIVRASNSILWISCRLEFNGRKQEVMRPGRYTQLFFLDDAVALAAGHRPCGECRRESYRAYRDAVNRGADDPVDNATDLNRRLRTSRNEPRRRAAIAALPDGVFVESGGDFRLLWDETLWRWTPEGYVDPIRAVGEATVLTPELSVDALRHGYPVEVHPSAQ
ncbi:hypothetical protein [Mycolicibacterium lacusdiani]|uniref:hypothetical protein n=1 Tax=Mycolicibacterium lacusdiani TaxID=2895283 RepID=UPI001F2E57D2|nr:hypothetical protein [Mycolicibacterium lacusdiani]